MNLAHMAAAAASAGTSYDPIAPVHELSQSLPTVPHDPMLQLMAQQQQQQQAAMQFGWAPPPDQMALHAARAHSHGPQGVTAYSPESSEHLAAMYSQLLQHQQQQFLQAQAQMQLQAQISAHAQLLLQQQAQAHAMGAPMQMFVPPGYYPTTDPSLISPPPPPPNLRRPVSQPHSQRQTHFRSRSHHTSPSPSPRHYGSPSPRMSGYNSLSTSPSMPHPTPLALQPFIGGPGSVLLVEDLDPIPLVPATEAGEERPMVQLTTDHLFTIFG